MRLKLNQIPKHLQKFFEPVHQSWLVRNDVIWSKRNAIPESVTDRFAKKHEYIFFMVKQPKYYFDLDSIRCVNKSAAPVKWATINTSFSSPALIPETNATVLTNDGSFMGRGRCDFSQTQVSVNAPVALNAQGLQILQLIGGDITLKVSERDYVMDLQHDILNTTDLTSVFISLSSKLPLDNPISTSVTDNAATPSAVILAAPIDAHITSHTLLSAKIVSFESAFISVDRIATKITLNCDGVKCSLFISCALVPAHSSCSPSNLNSILADKSKNIKGKMTADGLTRTTAGLSMKTAQEKLNLLGKNPGTVSDFWDITTKPSSEKHYASYNPELINKPILAGCPEFVCNGCGKPREKIVKKETTKAKREMFGEQPLGNGHQSSSGWPPSATQEVSYTDCGCGAGFSPGIVLDPFCGTGTTLEAAHNLDRRWIGIDGNAEYVKMANERMSIVTAQTKLF